MTFMNVYIRNCVIICTAILHICAYIYIPMYKNKVMSIYIPNFISYIFCNTILPCTICSDLYNYIYRYMYIHRNISTHSPMPQARVYVCVYIYT